MMETAHMDGRIWSIEQQNDGTTFSRFSPLPENVRSHLDKYLRTMYSDKSGGIVPVRAPEEYMHEYHPETEFGYFAPKHCMHSALERLMSDVFLKTATNTACFFVRRSILGSPDIAAFTATSCIDYVFATNYFREFSYLYRNTDRMIMTLRIDAVPDYRIVMRKWDVWCRKINIIDHSRRFLLVEKNGVHGLYTLGIGSELIETIQETSFEWDRTNQLWVSKKANLEDLAVMSDIIREDSLPDPSSIGFVPEWYCSIQGRKNSYGSAMDLWKVLLGRN